MRAGGSRHGGPAQGCAYWGPMCSRASSCSEPGSCMCTPIPICALTMPPLSTLLLPPLRTCQWLLLPQGISNVSSSHSTCGRAAAGSADGCRGGASPSPVPFSTLNTSLRLGKTPRSRGPPGLGLKGKAQHALQDSLPGSARHQRDTQCSPACSPHHMRTRPAGMAQGARAQHS